MKRCRILLLLCSAIAALAVAGNAGGKMETAVVTSMRKVPCIDGLDGDKQTESYARMSNVGGECIEYELRSETVRYVIRPRGNVLLLLGNEVSIRPFKSELLLHTGEAPKDIHCAVRAMTLLLGEKRKAQTEPPNPPRLCIDRSGDEVPCPRDAAGRPRP